MAKKKDRNPAPTLRKVYEASKKHRKECIEEKWDSALKAYKAEKDTSSVQPSSQTRVTKTRTNFIFSQIETMKAILAASRPAISVKAIMTWDPWWVWMADEITKNINRVFTRNTITVRQIEFITNSMHFGKAYFKPTWSAEGFGGYGDVKIEVPDTRAIFLEPGKMSVADSNYIFERTSCSMLTLIRKYPAMEGEIRRLFAKGGSTASPLTEPAPTSTEQSYSTETNVSAPDAAANTTSTDVFKVMEDAMGTDRKEAELVEAWFWDPEMVETLEDALSDTGQKMLTSTGNRKKEKRQTPRFPNGRLVQFAGNLTFRDQQNKFPDLPYVEYFNYSGPDWPYGLPEAYNLVPIQKQIDIRKNQVADILNTMLAPKVFYDASAGLDPDTYTNEPGQLIPVRNVQGIKIVEPPHMGVAASATIAELKTDMETVSGIREVTQGSIPGDIRSGTAIELLQESGELRMQPKSQLLQVTYAELAKHVFRLQMKFYKEGVHWSVPDTIKRDKKWEEWVESGNMPADMFEFEVRAGVNLPRSRVAQQQLMLQYHERELADDEYMVQHSNLPNKEQLMERQAELWELKRELLKKRLKEELEGQPNANTTGAAQAG